MLLQILIHQPRMLAGVIQNTPGWVWGLLAVLLAAGVSQWLPRRASAARIAILPAAMAVFALVGLFTAFGGSGHGASTTAVWLASLVGSTMLALRLRPHAPPGTRFDSATRQFQLPGSALPLLTILGIFLTKYAVAIELALQPALAGDLRFSLGVAMLYGGFNGIFAARFLRLRCLARHGNIHGLQHTSIAMHEPT
ncbi:hypothetical protein O4H66_06345 [Comamonadaceae bacterium G21597-S1]|nr:hypothetical protein [Comamonadaceae bacterium G21597-S1]